MNTIPRIGFGTCRIAPEETQKAVEQALDAGYRHLDTATIYKNEAGVGAAINASGLPRNDIFLTTKLWNTDQGFDTAIEACERSLEILDQNYLDLYLIHWAQPAQGRYLESWKALIELRERELVRNIGVSNFTAAQLDEIIAATGVTPVCNQIEVHPYFAQTDMLAENKKRGIETVAWSPLGNGTELDDAVLAELAGKYGISTAQLILAWHNARGSVVIPKTVTPSRMVENLEAMKIELAAEDVEAITALSKPDGRMGGDPAEGDLGAPEYSDRRS